MLIEKNPGLIEAQDAHVWWNDRIMVVRVVPLDPGLTARLTREGYNYGTGASFTRWKDASDAERVREMIEVAIKLMVEGYDPAMVVREFSKVRQFLQLGAESFVMCRALTKVFEGRANENTEQFRTRFLKAG
jgi:hypothetical protein